MMKRERRSIGKSPLKNPSLSADHQAVDNLPSLSGYLEIARQKRGNSRRSGSFMKEPSSAGKSVDDASENQLRKPATQASAPEQNSSGKKESSFARMAREKRAARKGL